MPSLFDPQVNQSIRQRIEQLTPESTARWGKMNVAQMLAHLNTVLQLATGDKSFKPNLIGIVLGPWIKRMVLNEKPYKQNLPTAPSFVVADSRVFAAEKQHLLITFQQFINDGENAAEGRKHPIFGKLTAAEWGFSQWKHFDHHLQQFGV
ncbi:MAG: DUF1569 domain-containing protein [Sphingobacteriia bacterium]|nr:DUF1569 domain-containing protein [Sphingobacteriia bacterium]